MNSAYYVELYAELEKEISNIEKAIGLCKKELKSHEQYLQKLLEQRYGKSNIENSTYKTK